jgi:hypothetical protein
MLTMSRDAHKASSFVLMQKPLFRIYIVLDAQAPSAYDFDFRNSATAGTQRALRICGPIYLHIYVLGIDWGTDHLRAMAGSARSCNSVLKPCPVGAPQDIDSGSTRHRGL